MDLIATRIAIASKADVTNNGFDLQLASCACADRSSVIIWTFGIVENFLIQSIFSLICLLMTKVKLCIHFNKGRIS